MGLRGVPRDQVDAAVDRNRWPGVGGQVTLHAMDSRRPGVLHCVLLLAVGGLVIASCGGKASSIRTDGGAAGDGMGGGGDDTLTDGGGVPTDGGSSGDGSSVTDSAGGCKPLPGCSSTTSCPATDGCNTCSCEQGVWECTGYVCPEGGGNVDCPSSGAESGEACPTEYGASCTYYEEPGYVCAKRMCQCSGFWNCVDTDCVDASASPCPESEPAQGSACTPEGTFCPYGAQCIGSPSTECLCSNGAWDCASRCGDQ